MKANITRVTVRGSRMWVVTEWHNGKRGRRKYFPTRKLAVAYQKDLEIGLPSLSEDLVRKALTFYLSHQNNSTTNSMPVSEAVNEYLKEKEAGRRRPRTVNTIRLRLSPLLKTFPDRKVGSINAGLITSTYSHWKGRTRKTGMVDVSSFFIWCVKRGYAGSNPCEGLEVPLVDETEPKVLTPEEGRSLLNACLEVDPGMVAYFAIGMFCGVRPGTILRLRNEDIEGGHIYVRGASGKTRDAWVIEVTENCQEWLALGYGFPLVNFLKRSKAVRKAAGLFDGWQADCMRDSFASYYSALYGVDRAKQQLNHRASTDTIYRHYRVPAYRSQAEEWFGIRP